MSLANVIATTSGCVHARMHNPNPFLRAGYLLNDDSVVRTCLVAAAVVLVCPLESHRHKLRSDAVSLEIQTRFARGETFHTLSLIDLYIISLFRSLIAMVRLWQETLSPDQIGAVFRASKPLFVGEASGALTSRYPSIHAVEAMWTRGHSKMCVGADTSKC